MKRTGLLLKLAILVTTISLGGCIVLAPFIQAWKNVGATPEDRRALLGLQVKKFGDALYWGKGEAAMYVDRDADIQVKKELNIDRDELRIVETKLKSVEYSEDTYTADIEFVVKFYRIPYYIVTSSPEKQTWKFRLGDNWYLLKREAGKELKTK